MMIVVTAYWYLRRRAEARIRDKNSNLTGHAYPQELLRVSRPGHKSGSDGSGTKPHIRSDIG